MTKNIDAEIISKDKKFWLEVKAKTEQTLFNHKKEIEISELLLKHAIQKINACK